jgi:hypothetical protein
MPGKGISLYAFDLVVNISITTGKTAVLKFPLRPEAKIYPFSGIFFKSWGMRGSIVSYGFDTDSIWISYGWHTYFILKPYLKHAGGIPEVFRRYS